MSLLLFSLFVASRAERGVRVVAFVAPVALALGWTAFQILPMPHAVVAWLSPSAIVVREDLAGQTAAFLPLTLDVPATLLELCKGLMYAAILFVVSTLSRSRRTAKWFLVSLALLGGVIGAIHFAQRFSGTQKLLWFYEVPNLPGSGFFGTFVAGNHAASAFALSALIAVGLMLEERDAWFFPMAISTTLSTGALLSTASRAGAAAFALGLFVLMISAAVKRFGVARGAVLAGILFAVVAGASYQFAEGVRKRMNHSEGGNLVDNQKTRGWRAGLDLAADYWKAGAGRGAFDSAVLAYRVRDEGVRLVYPENMIVQGLSEWGVPIATLLLVLSARASVTIARRLRRRHGLGLGGIGAACGVTTVLLHELFDFGLEMPGVAIPTMTALAVVVGGSIGRDASEETRGSKLPRWVPWAACTTWVLVLLGGVWATPRTLYAETGKAQRLVRERALDADKQIHAFIARHPADDILEMLAAQASMTTDGSESVKHLNRALQRHPANWQAHLLAARVLLRARKLSQAAIEYRLAAEHGMRVPYDEIITYVPNFVVDAVPQTVDVVLELARRLAHKSKFELADSATVRAAELERDGDMALRERAKLARVSKNVALQIRVAAALCSDVNTEDACADSADLYELALQPKLADEIFARAAKQFPTSAKLRIKHARVLAARQDWVGARAVLRTTGNLAPTLVEREAIASLGGEIAQNLGDAEGAIRARARAKQLREKIQEEQSAP